jgi:urate oxidase
MDALPAAFPFESAWSGIALPSTFGRRYHRISQPRATRLEWSNQIVTVVLTDHSYGKCRIRLTKVTRRDGRHDVRELSIDITLEGDFERSFTSGDNRLVIPTDTMKNVAFALAKERPLEALEDFAAAIAGHFIESHAHVSMSRVRIDELPLDRIRVDGREHPHAFSRNTSERRTTTVTHTRGGLHVESGLEDLFLLKSAGSAFCGFLTDRHTTLKDAPDRILATMLEAAWLHRDQHVNWNASHARIRQSLLETFANHDSLSVQQTLYAMGERVLASAPEVEKITLTMPNKHRILADLKPFGLDNANEIFVATDEPYGSISGTLSRLRSPVS